MKCFIPTSLFLCISLFSFSQSHEESNGKVILQHADSLYNLGNYHLAAVSFKEAAQFFKKENLRGYEAKALNGLAQMQWRMFRLAEAKQSANQALAVYTSNDYDDSLSTMNMAMSYNSLGVIYGMESNFQAALQEFARVIEIGKKDMKRTRRLLGIAHHNIGRLNMKFGNLDSAIFHFEKSLSYKDTATPEDRINLADTYYVLGAILTDKGYCNQAINYLGKTLNLQRSELGEKNPRLANTYSEMGMTCFNLGQYQLATDYIKKAIKIVENKQEMEQYRLHFYVMLVDILIRKKEYDEALSILTEILKLRLASPDTDEISFAYTYDFFAQIYLGKYQIDEAKKYALKSYGIKKSIFGEKSIGMIYSHPLLARIYHLLGNDSISAHYVEKGVQILKQSSYKQSPYLADLYNLKAEFLLENEQYAESVQAIAMAIQSNTRQVQREGEQAPFKEVLDRQELLTSIALKAKNHYKLFETTRSQDALQASLANYASCDSLMDIIRRSSIRFQDRIAHSDYSKEIYGEAIQTCVRSYEITGLSSFKDKAFYFAEKAKVSALSYNLQAIAAKEATNLPDSLWKVEEKIKVDLSKCQSQINDKLVSDEPDKKEALADLESRRFNLELELDSFYTYLDKKDRDYYNLKYNNEVVALTTIQDKLSKDEVILEYFSDGGSLFVFAISKSDFFIQQINDYQLIRSTAEKFVNLFNDFEHKRQSIQTFEKYSYDLYEYLLSDVIGEFDPGVEKLIIVPTPELSMLPWDLLITKPGGSTSTDLDYLINQYTIHYGYSSTLHFRKSIGKKRNQRNILAIAPSYSESGMDEYFEVPQVFRGENNELRWNKSEVEAIEGIFDNTTVLENDYALESEFKSQASNYNILHLAMHAFVDHQESMNSRLIFTGKDSLDDGALHTYELFNMELDSDLAILSACQTGAGKIDKGEGVISLARGFAYAGVPSIVMSHWKVDDRSTGLLMQRFYKYLSEGQTKSEALRNAKLDFLKDASPNKKHPYYWGAFVTIGDDSPILHQKQPFYWIWLVLIFISLPIIFLLRKGMLSQLQLR